MPSKVCAVCDSLVQVKSDWAMISYSGDFVCSADCVMHWIMKQNSVPAVVEILKGKIVNQINPSRPAWPQFRSEFEVDFAKWLTKKGFGWYYEAFVFPVGETKTYTPDFWLPVYGTFIESKGQWGPGQKKKLKMFREQYPHVPLLVVPWMLANQFKESSDVVSEEGRPDWEGSEE